jgi:hypothetical protein
MSNEAMDKDFTLDLEKVKIEMRQAVQRHRYQDKIAHLEDEVDEVRRQQRKQKAQHDREIELVAMSKAAATAPSPSPTLPPAPLPSITVKRSNASAIDVVIDKALGEVGEEASLGVVYAELVRLAAASAPDRPNPFSGPASVNGIPYLHNNGRKSHFTRRALAGRLKTKRKAKL